MTKIDTAFDYPIFVSSDDELVSVDLGQGDFGLYPDEARELVKALKKHIKKAEGK